MVLLNFPSCSVLRLLRGDRVEFITRQSLFNIEADRICSNFYTDSRLVGSFSPLPLLVSTVHYKQVRLSIVEELNGCVTMIDLRVQKSTGKYDF